MLSLQVSTTVTQPQTAASPVERRWLICNQFCLDETLLRSMCQCNTVPAIGMAFLLQESASDEAAPRGAAFCFLPMPIETGLPVHTHANFQVRGYIYS